jgi:hypothetical protein
MFKPHRVYHLFRGARADLKKSKLSVTVQGADNTKRSIRVGRDDYPFTVTLPEFSLPTAITGQADPQEFCPERFRALGAWNFPQAARDLAKAHNATALQGQTKIPVDDFGRLLAKMAHCWGVATLGVDGFSPLLTKAIREGDTKDLSRYVGTDPGPQPAPNFSVHTTRMTVYAWKERDILVCEIESVAAVHLAPVYTVCFGRFNELTQERMDNQCLPAAS